MTESTEMKALHGPLKATDRNVLEPKSPNLSKAESSPTANT